MPARLHSLILSHAHRLLADLLASNGLTGGGTAEVVDGGWSIRVTAEPVPEAVRREYTACEADIITVLREQRSSGARLTTQQILDTLAARKLFHGTTTVKIALARLAREKVIGSSRRSPRGYWLHPRREEVGT